MQILPLENLRTTNVLWAINRVLFHPRGFALALQLDDDGKVEGWGLLGDGSEVWTFSTDDDDDGFAKFESFLNSHRKAVDNG